PKYMKPYIKVMLPTSASKKWKGEWSIQKLFFSLSFENESIHSIQIPPLFIAIFSDTLQQDMFAKTFKYIFFISFHEAS
ncbi:MAG: hypothetical protein DRN29_08370, partial [Thermoplasmata archaeon]